MAEDLNFEVGDEGEETPPELRVDLPTPDELIPFLEETETGVQEDDGEDHADLEDRIAALEEQVAGMPIPTNPLLDIQLVREGTGNTWGTVVPDAGTLTLAGNASSSNWTHYNGDTSSGGALISLVAGQSAVIALRDASSNQTRFIKFGGPSSAIGRITGVTGTHSAYVYGVTFQDGSTGSAYNPYDWNGTVAGLMIGSPCSLGITVGATGQVGTGLCVIAPSGTTGWMDFAYDPLYRRWIYKYPPSAD